MKQNLILLIFSFLIICNYSFAQVNSNFIKVNGYTRSDGTYVEPHYRTVANGTINDNYSTKGNVNPHTGKPGSIARDDDYVYSYFSSNQTEKKTYTYQKTLPLKDQSYQSYWINEKVDKFYKNSKKKNKKFKKNILSETKKNRKEIKNKNELNIKNFSNGWYHAMVYTKLLLNNDYEDVIFKREVLIENGSVVKYIGSNNLIYDIYDFDKINYSYKFKLIFPDNTISPQYEDISFYDPKPLNYIPYSEYPSIVFFYITENNDGGHISILLENDYSVFFGGYLKSYWNEIPNCQTKESVVKFYLPTGNYKFFAASKKSLWTNNSFVVNQECQGIRLNFN